MVAIAAGIEELSDVPPPAKRARRVSDGQVEEDLGSADQHRQGFRRRCMTLSRRVVARERGCDNRTMRSLPHRGIGLAVLAGMGVAVASTGVVLAAGVPSPAGSHPVAPSLFQPGSCVSFGPTVGNRHLRVFIDAGHGGIDPGGVGRTSTGVMIGEAPLNVAVAEDAATLLRRHGFTVVLSRTGPQAVARPAAGDISGGVYTEAGEHRELVARDLCADLAHANVVIGMDLDAAGSPAATGSVTLYDAVRPYADASRRLALLAQRDVLANLRADGAAISDLGVHTDVGYGHLTAADRAYGHLVLLGPPKRGYLSTPTLVPATLIEPLFLTNPTEASLADSRAGQEAIGRGLADAAEQFLASPKQSQTPARRHALSQFNAGSQTRADSGRAARARSRPGWR
jgi:N-acetylmuramoyl-L-alanine amidase